ncbi:MAG TPA: hypothetical protein VKQ29_17945 [Aliidongia sp.]|nr:hypothetical protein [Aliidongia sp.]
MNKLTIVVGFAFSRLFTARIFRAVTLEHFANIAARTTDAVSVTRPRRVVATMGLLAIAASVAACSDMNVKPATSDQIFNDLHSKPGPR